jgi:hypothetical protein
MYFTGATLLQFALGRALSEARRERSITVRGVDLEAAWDE